ncbi:hypothetical protein [Flavobacterium psychrophilum]|uniref:Lipoprotein n=1 Tax=Flavobacterium psychrophilum TaxID=96345 RepID=A0A7U2RB25_FLAPS|nr:hypothetical protein [Flavobacterium psychrophilum]ELV7526240.1 hypothetical protein [Flavobacterium psychrophilum]MCB6089527.1 hypothetical protein [Flavobacterium psychrophilum]MCB6231884.1 hypothetical protein [Flavobacterium psychrophilum]MEB3380592.1 hypothetical protein [Flavobacterium psychrophilum]OAE90502.1 hypothetical protein SU65_12250 [Flavobacterium psychrophilum]
MKNKIKKIVLLLNLSFLIYSCNGQSIDTRNKEKYKKYKNEFNSKLTNHFPLNLTAYPNNIINSKNISKNTVGFILYEYERDIVKIDSVIKSIQSESIAKYNSKDLCLLIVNRFETFETLENMEEVVITDSTKINQDCYKKLYPIPNFIDYEYPNKSNDLKLDGNFDIYVIEAKSGNHFKEFDLLPNPQMPPQWQNGYSKGIAISKEKKTIIYWGIIW